MAARSTEPLSGRALGGLRLGAHFLQAVTLAGQAESR